MSRTSIVVACMFFVSSLTPVLAAEPQRCRTREISTTEAKTVQKSLDRNGGKGKAAKIPVWFHVITAGSSYGQGNLSDQTVRDQVRVIDQTFAGMLGGAYTGFSFELKGITRTENPAWFAMTIGSDAEAEAKAALRQGGPETLNIYSTDGGGYLGWATFPWWYEDDPSGDGIVIDFRSTPGGPYGSHYSLGYTASHEAGHWLALFHTFQDSCSQLNDFVSDTAAEKFPASGCPIGLDTCIGPKYVGVDPIHNFMDYSYDSCYFEFTAGQSDRMQTAWVTYRQ